MKFADEFRDPELAGSLVREITRLADGLAAGAARPLQVMEVCGGHTHTIFRYGLKDLLPQSIEFVHGPGCPVCVLPMGRVDDCVAIAEHPQVIMTTFGDAMRVPGSRKSLLQAKADGADVRTVYSPLDALKLAQKHPDKDVVFFGLGFETTMPSTAMTVLQAEALGVRNFSLFCNHITIIPTVKAILDSPDLQIDGFLGPGHVSMVIGTRPYDFIAEQYQRPLVVAGFEPLDILQSLWMVLKQIDEGRCEVENEFSRAVTRDGNAKAQNLVSEMFELRRAFEWRGLGDVPYSALAIRAEYAAWDAEKKFALQTKKVADNKACECGAILRGVKHPRDCKLFGTVCTPENPVGSCMVSSEGACAAHYSYGRYKEIPIAAE